jgi:hypothetical protein
MIKLFFQKVEKYGVILLVLALLIGGTSLIFHFWNPLKDLLGIGKKETPVTQTQEYITLQKDRDKQLQDASYWHGRYVQDSIDHVNNQMELTKIQPIYIQSVREAQSLKPGTELDGSYYYYLTRLNAELKKEGLSK